MLTFLAVAEAAHAFAPRIAGIDAQGRVAVLAGVDLGTSEAEAVGVCRLTAWASKVPGAVAPG